MATMTAQFARKKHDGTAFPGASRRPPAPLRLPAFTLVELLVVIAIIVIIAAVATPAMNTILKGNAAKQGANMVSAYLTSARATAMNLRKPVAVVFYDDPNNGNQTSVVLMQQRAVDPAFDRTMDLIDGRDPELLPRGTRVATLGDATSSPQGAIGVDQAANGTAPRCRAVLFDEAGRMICGRLQVDTLTPAPPVGTVFYKGQLEYTGGTFYQCTGVTTSSPGTGNWTISPTLTPVALAPVPAAKLNLYLHDGNQNPGFTSPGILVYDGAAYDSGNVASLPESGLNSRTAWFQQNGVLLVVNAYTGAVIR